jgi:hypothetical protein
VPESEKKKQYPSNPEVPKMLSLKLAYGLGGPYYSIINHN